MKSPGILKWQPSVSHWTSARLALARLFARQSSLLKVCSLCMRTVRLKRSECTVNWGEWAGGWGVSISYAQFLIGSHYNWLGADLPPASRGCTKPRMENLWHAWYGRMRTTLRFPPCHHAQQKLNERRLRTIHSRLLSFKVRRKVDCVQTCSIFPFVKLETSAHRPTG